MSDKDFTAIVQEIRQGMLELKRDIVRIEHMVVDAAKQTKRRRWWHF